MKNKKVLIKYGISYEKLINKVIIKNIGRIKTSFFLPNNKLFFKEFDNINN